MTVWNERHLTSILLLMVYLLHGNSIASEIAEPQETPIRITIKENQVYSFTSIEKVEYWGIVVSENGTTQTILYKVMEKIEMADSSLVSEIEYHVPGIEVTEIEGIFTLDFKHASIPVLESREQRILHLKYVPLALRFDPVETFEAGLVYSLWPLHLIHHNFSFSTGFPYSTDPSYHVMALNYGIGTPIHGSGNLKFLYRIYFHFKVMERTHGYASSFFEMSTISIEPQVHFFPAKRAFPSISFRYYLDNFEIKNEKSKLFLITNLNVALGTMD